MGRRLVMELVLQGYKLGQSRSCETREAQSRRYLTSSTVCPHVQSPEPSPHRTCLARREIVLCDWHRPIPLSVRNDFRYRPRCHDVCMQKSS